MKNSFIMLAIAMFISTAFTLVRAESHTIHFNNKNGEDLVYTLDSFELNPWDVNVWEQPQVVIGGKVVSNGGDWTTSVPQAGIAYLQTGPCLLNGENCALVEFNFNNPTPGCSGCGTFVDISLIPPHALNVPTAFSFFNGCDGQGASCSTSGCGTAYHNSNDNQVIVACMVNNVDLLITFCP